MGGQGGYCGCLLLSCCDDVELFTVIISGVGDTNYENSLFATKRRFRSRPLYFSPFPSPPALPPPFPPPPTSTLTFAALLIHATRFLHQNHRIPLEKKAKKSYRLEKKAKKSYRRIPKTPLPQSTRCNFKAHTAAVFCPRMHSTSNPNANTTRLLSPAKFTIA